MTVTQLVALLNENYPFGTSAGSISEIGHGVGTRNFRAETDLGSVFVKEYPSKANLEDEEQALLLGEHARVHGIPTPEILRTTSGKLIAKNMDTALSVHTWALGHPVSELELATARSAGYVLGAVHSCFRRTKQNSAHSKRHSKWKRYDHDARKEHFTTLLRELKDGDRDDFAKRAVLELSERIELLELVPEMMVKLADLPIQVIHGDSSVLNFLFDDFDEVTAIVDFRPPEVYLPDFELARIAFDPATVTNCDDWKEISFAAYRGYRDGHGQLDRDLALGPKLWCCKLLRSDYGLVEHIRDPHSTEQWRLDRYWHQRCGTVSRLLPEIDELEAAIRAISSFDKVLPAQADTEK